MEVHVLFECFGQESFIAFDRCAEAEPAREVVGIYSNILKATEEKERRESAIDPDDPDNGEDVPYYEIESHEVE